MRELGVTSSQFVVVKLASLWIVSGLGFKSGIPVDSMLKVLPLIALNEFLLESLAFWREP